VVGTVKSVSKTEKGVTLCVVDGVQFYSHEARKVASVTLKIFGGCFVLDGRLVKEETALVPGRELCAMQNRVFAVLSEAGTRTMGKVVKADGDKLVLGSLLDKGVTESTVALAADARYLQEGKAATREAVLAAGNVVRVSPARQTTVLAYTEKTLVTKRPWMVSVAVAGKVKGSAVSYANPDGTISKLGFRIAERKASGGALDAWTTYGVTPDPAHPCLAQESPGTAIGFKKRGKQVVPEKPTLQGYESYILSFWPEPGRVDGEVTAFDAAGRSLKVKTLQDGEVKEVTVTLPADVEAKLDGADATPAEALQPGAQVTVFPAKPQTVEVREAVTALTDAAAAGH
jgi:hypothetical protein